MTPPLVIYRKYTNNIINTLPRYLYINVKMPLHRRKIICYLLITISKTKTDNNKITAGHKYGYNSLARV